MQNKNSQSNIGNTVKKIYKMREASLALILVIMIVLMSIFIPGFLSGYNISTTMVGLSMDGLLAIGMTLVLVLGGIDLSVGSVMALSGVIAGMLVVKLGVNIWIASFVAIAVCAVAGYIISYCINEIKINPFITTLSMMSITRGLAYILTEGSPISLGNIENTFDFIGRGEILGIPNPVLVLIVTALVFDYLMRNSRKIREIYYVGSNEKAAKLSGIKVKKVKMMVYIICTMLSGVAGIITLSRFGVATPTTGVSAELRVIAGAVIGGASLTGGVGTVLGTIMGIVLVALVNNALVLLNVSVYWQTLVTGLVLLSAVIVDMKLNERPKAK